MKVYRLLYTGIDSLYNKKMKFVQTAEAKYKE